MNKKSFTLIELLVVIAIIGILSSLVIARFSDWGDNARIANTLQWSAGVHRTLGANLVGYWPLNGDVNDISGYENHGVLLGSTSWVQSVLGETENALRFNTTSDALEIEHSSELDLTREMSISLWFKLDVLSDTTRTFISKTDPGFSGRTTFWIDVRNQNNIFFGGYSPTESGKYTFFNYDKLEPNKWIHFMGVDTGAPENKYLIYINGNQEHIDVSNERISGSWNIFIGGRGSSTSNPFLNGVLDDIRIYNTALTAEEVGRIYAESRDRYLVDNQ